MKLAVAIIFGLILLGLSFGAGQRMHFASPNNQATANATPINPDTATKPANPDTGTRARTITLRSAKCEFQWAIDRLDHGGQMQCVPVGSTKQ